MVKLDNERGSICISSEVFTWLAGDAVGLPGGGTVAPDTGAVTPDEGGSVVIGSGEDTTTITPPSGQPVTPNDDGSITIELHIVVDHGVNIAALCSSIMNEVSYKVSSATDVSVRQVDVYVDSMTMD